ncbi:MAG: hypothetical protein QW091_00155 [Candidatus Micrarchaeaceae archaeon]
MSVMPFGSYGYEISILVISIMIAASGIVLGIGFATENRRLKDFGKNELMQCAINGALVGSLLVLFVPGGAITTMINGLAMQNTQIACPSMLSQNAAMCLAYNYLVGSSSYVFMGHANLSILYISTAMLLPLYVLYALLGVFSTFLAPLLSQIKYLTQILSTTIISATVQAAFLLFSAASALTILMPLGLVLRAFYPSRKLGGFLIAAAIGMYAVFPLTYVLNAYVASGFTSSASTGSNQVSIVSGTLQQSLANVTASGTGLLSSAYTAIKSAINDVASLLNMLFGLVAYLIVYAFVLPAFSVVITVISVKELAQLLGSDASFLNKLNMV